jgi:hypothetical protein
MYNINQVLAACHDFSHRRLAGSWCTAMSFGNRASASCWRSLWDPAWLGADFADGKGLGLTATAGNVEQRSNVFKIYLICALLSLFLYIYISNIYIYISIYIYTLYKGAI